MCQHGQAEARYGRGAILQQSGTQSCAIAARAHSAQLLADRATSARAMVDTLRGHVRRGACGPAFCLCGSSEAWRSVAPHLPTAVTGSSKSGRDSSKVERRFWFLQASARACVSPGAHGRAVGNLWHGQSKIEQATAVRMVARRYACDRFARARQGVPRRLPALAASRAPR
eukprot:scaffold45156_cov63-Phaeocystis_antarctica.AAC.2